MNRKLILTAALLFAGNAAMAFTTEAVIDDLSAQGYTRIEVRNGLTQTKVEAIRGAEKLEVIYDRSTGAVLKSETERVDDDDNTRPGVSVRNRNRDFVRVSSRDDDDRDDDSDDRNSDDDDDGDDRSDDDDRGDDDGDNDRDGDDNGGDDNGGDRGGDNDGGDRGGDDSGDDRSGDDDGGDRGGDDNGGDRGGDDGDDD